MKIILFSGFATCGKDSTAKILKGLLESEDKKVLICHYADLLKYLCETFFNWDGKKDEKGRSLLQFVGTDVIRKKNPDYWVDFIIGILKLFENQWDYILIPDMRFPNEAFKMMKTDWDVLTVRVNRLNYENPLTVEQRKHPSETALDNFRFDYYLDSESGLDNLTIETGKLFNYIATRWEVVQYEV